MLPPYAGLAVALELGGRRDDSGCCSRVRPPSGTNSDRIGPRTGRRARCARLDSDWRCDSDWRLREKALDRAERSLRRALDLDPSLSMTYNWLSNTLQQQGRVEEANAVQERGLLVDPLNPVLSRKSCKSDKTAWRTRTRRATHLATDPSAGAPRDRLLSFGGVVLRYR